MPVFRRGRMKTRRPVPPSLRLPPASMGRASFVWLVALWLLAILVVLAIVLAVRGLG